LGRMLRDAARQEKYTAIVDIIRQLALTGCRRSEMIGLKWTEANTESSCLRLEDSKEGESNRENLAHPTRFERVTFAFGAIKLPIRKMR
jgi:integrase